MFRIGSPAARAFLYLFLLLFALGLVLVLLGFDLDAVDRWLDDRDGQVDTIGSWLFRVVSGVVLALCALAVLGGLWQRFVAPRGQLGDAADFVTEPAPLDEFELEVDAAAKQPVGWGCMIVAVIVGYFAWFGMTG